MKALSTIVIVAVAGGFLAPQPCQAVDWSLILVDDGINVGPYMDIAVEPETGVVYLSYYDEVDGDLWFARRVGSGGDCGPDNTWHCDHLDSTGDVGKYNSIAVRHKTDGTGVAIAYYDQTNGALKEADVFCPDACGTWAVQTIDAGNPEFFTYKGLHTDITYDSNGLRHITYQFWTALSDEVVKHAYYTSGGGNCGEGYAAGYWQCGNVFTGAGVGQFLSLDTDETDVITGYENLKRPSISFWDSSNNQAYLAYWADSGGNCGTNNSWYCQSVAMPGEDSGIFTSHFVEADGTAHVAFLSTTGQDLIYATYVGAGGNCGFNSWQCNVIDDDVGPAGSTRGVSIAPDANGYPVIVYRDASDDFGPSVLKVARPIAADMSMAPNCGPVDLFYTWNCSTVDPGGQYLEEASAVAVAVGPAGEIAAVYREFDTYYNVGRLKAALYPDSYVFSDDFESSDTSHWSTVSP